MTEQHLTDIISHASRRAGAFLALLYILAFGLLLVSDTSKEFMAICIAIAAGSILIVPRFIWAIRIHKKRIVLSFPLCPWLNRTFTAEEINEMRVVRNPIRIFAFSDFVLFKFRDRRHLSLLIMGTQNAEILEHYMKPPSGVPSRHSTDEVTDTMATPPTNAVPPK